MNLRDEIELFLPTRGARWSLLLTGALLTPAFLAPRFLQPLLAPIAAEAEIVLLQILLAGVIAVSGVLMTLLLILWHLRNEEKNRKTVLKELNDAYQKDAQRKKRTKRI